MNTKKILSAALAASLVLAGCDVNELPSFSDSEAFVAFTTTQASIDENSTDSLVIEVLCTSLSGITSTVAIEVVDTAANAAKRNVQFTISTTCGNDSLLTFDKEHTSQKIIIKPIDNDVFTGDKSFTINLGQPSKGKLGYDKSCQVIVADDEHPLAFILGSFTGKAVSYYNGAEEWTVKLSKDPDGDLTKVWITNLVKGGSSSSCPVYGFVNAEKTTLSIPVGQELAKSSSYAGIILEGFRGEDGDDDIPTGESINASIAPDGTITILDWFGSHVYSTPGVSAGWYNIVKYGAVLTKN